MRLWRVMICGVALSVLTGCPGPAKPDPARCEVTVDRPTGAIADGADPVQVRVTVRDAAGQPMPGVQVELAATGAGNTLLQPAAPTDGTGVATGTLATTTAESKTISASIPQGSIPATATAVFSEPRPRLRFVQGPADMSVEASSLLPPVAVAILDGWGTLTSSTAAVTVSLSSNPSGGTLQGTTTVAAINGIATFTDLSVDRAGTYRLSAGAGTFDDVQSADFTIAAPSADVTGTMVIRHVLADGSVVNRPQDLSGVIISAYVPNGAGSYTIIDGLGTSAGTFRIPNVPAGARYLLHQNDSLLGNNFFETNARTLDLGYFQFGRPDVAYAGLTTVHHNSFSGMKPWTVDPQGQQDWLEMTSINAGLSISPLQNYSTFPPGRGETEFTGDTSYDLLEQIGFQPTLVDASKGDRTYVTQLAVRSAGAWVDDFGTVIQQNTYHAVESACGPLAATVVDGQSSSVSGTFSPVARQSLPVGWLIRESTPGSFGSFRDAVNPSAMTDNHRFDLMVLPSGFHDFGGAVPPELLNLQLNDVAATPQLDQQLTLQYGNPFPTSWVTVAEATTRFRVPVQVPRPGGGTAPATVLVRLVAADRLSAFPTTSIRPQVGPITGALIDGTDFRSDQTLRNTTPTVQWNAPALGTPSYYSVTIRKLSAGATSPATQEIVGRLVTRANQIKVPPGILRAASSYVFLVRAVIKGGYSLETAPNGGSFPIHYADSVSGLLLTP